MKTNRQTMMERKLLENMDELRRLEETLDWLYDRINDLLKAILDIEDSDPEFAEQLQKVYRPLNRKAEEVTARVRHLEEHIDRLYADLLIQEAEAIEEDLEKGKLTHPALQQMLPPYVAQQRATLL